MLDICQEKKLTPWSMIFTIGKKGCPIEFFWLTMCEIARVPRKEGPCCIIAPSPGPQHGYPKDCWRFFPDALEAVARYAMLEIVESYTCGEPMRNGENNIWKDTVLICRKPIRGLNIKM